MTTFIPPPRADRHPYEVVPMIVLPIVLVIYIFISLHKGTLTTHMLTVAGSVILGCVLTIVGAVLPRGYDIRVSIQIGIFGQLAVLGGLAPAVYDMLTDSVARPIIEGFMVSICFAAAVRIVQGLRELMAIRRIVNVGNGISEGHDEHHPGAAGAAGGPRDAHRRTARSEATEQTDP